MIDPHSATTALNVANSALGSVKAALELVKKSKDLDLKHEISNAMDSVLELKAKVLDLGEENRTLRLRLEQKDNIKREPKHGFWLKEGETQPLCPNCYESEKHLVVYLTPAKFSQSFGYRRSCHVCGRGYDSSKLVHDSDFQANGMR